MLSNIVLTHPTLFIQGTYVMSSPYNYTKKNSENQIKFWQGLQIVLGEWIPHLVHLESSKLCSFFTGKLQVFRTLWICWSLESPALWPRLVSSLQQIMVSSLFYRIMKKGDEVLFEEIRKSVPSSQVLSEGTSLWGKGKQGGRFLGRITAAPAKDQNCSA